MSAIPETIGLGSRARIEPRGGLDPLLSGAIKIKDVVIAIRKEHVGPPAAVVIPELALRLFTGGCAQATVCEISDTDVRPSGSGQGMYRPHSGPKHQREGQANLRQEASNAHMLSDSHIAYSV